MLSRPALLRERQGGAGFSLPIGCLAFHFVRTLAFSAGGYFTYDMFPVQRKRASASEPDALLAQGETDL